MTSHDQLLDRYAELIIRSGLNVRAGQQVLMTAPLEAVDLVRRVSRTDEADLDAWLAAEAPGEPCCARAELAAARRA